jgi:hypothetical protein
MDVPATTPLSVIETVSACAGVSPESNTIEAITESFTFMFVSFMIFGETIHFVLKTKGTILQFDGRQPLIEAATSYHE